MSVVNPGLPENPFKVVIAGGGVAALEAMLALRRLAGPSQVAIELICPEREFTYRPLAVSEPFGLGEAPVFELAPLLRELSAEQRHDTLASVTPEARTVRTGSDAEVAYDALLLAIGTKATPALPGALTYAGRPDNPAFHNLLEALEWGTVSRVAFAAPAAVHWTLPIYELAVMSAAHLTARHVESFELSVVSAEPKPLSVFGAQASASVRRLLDAAGVAIHTGDAPSAFRDGVLHLAGGDSLAVDRVVAMPRLSVAPIVGIPQGPHGFIGTDRFMQVEGLSRVYAAGDATWFPVKQGGLACQQADVAATSIAACAGLRVERRPFEPVLRGAILTGGRPRYLRAGVGSSDSSADVTPLWWPPSKIAGTYLSDYLSHRLSGGRRFDPSAYALIDRDPLRDKDSSQAEHDHADAFNLALAAADAEARWRDYEGALRWLQVAEQTNLVLPPRYAERRRRWLREKAECERVGRAQTAGS